MSDRLLDSLIKRIRQLRELRGQTQEAFAEEAEISYKYYQAIEAGRKSDLRLSTLQRLAEAHDLEVWQLLSPQGPAPVERKQARHGKSSRRPRRRK